MFTIAGVTFEGRQEAVRELKPDQIILLEREPWNTHDADAVRVMDHLGRTLGFVPRKDGLNARFKYERCFALVASAGPAAGVNAFGARFYARPKLPNLLLDPLPLASGDAARFADLASLFGERWPALRTAALAAANDRCEVTGLDQGQLPLQVVPTWRYNGPAKAAQLCRLMVLCQPLAELKARLEERVAAAGKAEAEKSKVRSRWSPAPRAGSEAAGGALAALARTPDGAAFMEVNGISEEDAVGYFQLVWRGVNVSLEEGWRLEVLL